MYGQQAANNVNGAEHVMKQLLSALSNKQRV